MNKLILLLYFIPISLFAREIGQTEITTDDGIEVFQIEKYYLLKKNVIITSDEFILNADFVKAFFNKDLYDIEYMESEGNVKFKSSKGAEGEGQKINFSLKNNLIEVFGENSFLIMNDLKMISDRFIKIDDTKGEFFLEGKNSKLETEDKIIVGNNIEGTYEKINEQNEIISLNATVEDGGLVEITTKTLKMFSLKAIYSKKDNIIELFDSVKVIRNNETIVGDYAKVNTLDESYKVTSYNTNKVKVLIDNTNE